MKVTIAILCSKDHLIKKCLASIPANVPIIVMLNNPDRYVEKVVSQDKRIRVFRYDEPNLGLLRQMAAEHCETEGILFLDSDCVLTPGTVEHVENELELYGAVSVPMRYRYHNLATKIVSECRKFTTPDEMLFIPAAFRISIQEKIGGYLYDKHLEWGEDSDQRIRLGNARIPFGVSKGCVLHKALTIKEDVWSACRLGRGTYIQVKYGVAKPRSVLHDLSIPRELRMARSCADKQGTLAGLYHFFVWRPVYKYGYWREIVDANKNRNHRKRL